MKFEIKQYQQAKQKQEEINSLQEEEDKRQDKVENSIYYKYSDLERDLRAKKRAEENEEQTTHEKTTDNLKQT